MVKMQTSIVELRQYTLRPGARDTLIELFDREFVESQEDTGMEIIGQFRDLGDADRFVWLRGFPSMDARAAALAAFYGGPVWKAHREAANATMLDSDNVLLLKPARAGSGFDLGALERAPQGVTACPPGVLTATILHLAAPAEEDLIAHFEREIMPSLAAAGTPALARLITETAENNFPALPVREGEHVFAWFSREGAQAAQPQWPARIASRFRRGPETLRLAPTARSRLRP